MLFHLLFLFIVTGLSTLKQGDDPYKILDVPKSATRQEIKASFRKLTMKYHPDLNKNEDTTAKWVKINDAYELLNDPDRKALYDRFGSIADEIPTTSSKSENPFADSDEHFFAQSDNIHIEPKTPLATVVNYESFISDGNEILFLVYSSMACPECQQTLQIFEKFAERYQKYCKCVRIDVAYSASLAKDLGAEGMPTILYYKKTEQGKISDYIPYKITQVRQISQFLASHWSCSVNIINTEKEFDDFMNDSMGSIKVIQFASTPQPSIQYNYLAHLFHKNVTFALIPKTAKSLLSKYKVNSFPTYLMFRHSLSSPTYFTSIKPLQNTLVDLGYPIMMRLHRYNFQSECSPKCLVRYGEGSKDLIRSLSTYKFSTYFVSSSSSSLKSLNISINQWVFINTKEKYYVPINNDNYEPNNLQEFINDFDKIEDNEKIKLPDDFNLDFELSYFFKMFKLNYINRLIIYVRSHFQLLLVMGAVSIDLIWFLIGKLRKANKKNKEKKNRREKINIKNEEIEKIENEEKKLLKENKKSRKERMQTMADDETEEKKKEEIDQQEKDDFLDGKIH
ncbi:dnaJ subfamily C member 16-like [Histomonas meleagridis]|uniref:dnaJ-like subfamily C member 16-like n=1 Tax=Histomonas meleagridis TaxID=135588 RepID=UPI00355AC043|nr:dnaJ subfamily C member 16-like [Histomonas meleagridis]KAH0801953.1 dnaJ-like subfamily C member 16-like [Histomonas meleagridis]